SRCLLLPGSAPPHGCLDAILMKGTDALRAVNEVSTPAEARAAIQAMAARQLKSVKIWVDDRRGTYPKMTPDVYNAIIAEAHAHRMIVNAHATTLADQTAVVRAGADVLVHMVQSDKIDDELIAVLREHRPYWATVIGLGDRSGACDDDPFFVEPLPASVVSMIRQSVEPKPLAPYCAPQTPN